MWSQQIYASCGWLDKEIAGAICPVFTNLHMQIAHKLELHVASLSPSDLDKSVWRRLGSMTFDSNENTAHKARELKSVQLDTVAQLLKIILHQPHANALNAHNQVHVKLAHN